jgi:hypothetical protein
MALIWLILAYLLPKIRLLWLSQLEDKQIENVGQRTGDKKYKEERLGILMVEIVSMRWS